MSNNGKSGGSGSGRRRRRRRGRNRKKNKNSGSRNRNRNRSRGRGSNRKRQGKKKQTPRDKFGGRDPKNVSSGGWDGPSQLNSFELFCSYHLGIFENNNYRDPSIKQVAKLFGRSHDDIRNALQSSGLDDNTIRQADYDLSLARLDVKVAPDGIDKRELAKNLFEEFTASHPGFIDWAEGAEDEEQDDRDEDPIEETA